MEKLGRETESIMAERFNKDTVIALATEGQGRPYVRYVNAYYENRSFYVITCGLSAKMRQMKENPAVSIAGDWFTAQGKGENLGYFHKEENREIAGKLEKAFSSWIHNGHNDFSDENTCILRLRLEEGVLFSQGTRYDIDFTE